MFLNVLLACSPGVDLTETVPSDVTWHRDLRPIADQYCVQCHETGGIAPYDLSDPDVVSSIAPLMVGAVADRRMPPWGLDGSCRDSVGSLWLPDAAVATFAGWQGNGYALGDEAEYVASAPILPPPDPGPPDLVLSPPEPYAPNLSGPDDYRCLPVADALDEELYLVGVRTVPQNLAIAHHVILYAVPPDGLADLEALDAADPAPGYACFATSGIDNAMTVGGWAPGGGGRTLPDGIAQRVPAGSRLVLQMHYNTSNVVGDPGTDFTSAELWTLPPGEVPDQVMVVFPMVKLGLHLPAGEPNATATARSRIPIDGYLLGTTPHMHTLGRTLEDTLIRPDGSEKCLTRVSNWDFGWQRNYGLVPDGTYDLTVDDELELTCTYDTSDQTEDVWWGEGTSDEMCLDFLGVVVDWKGGDGGGTCAGFDRCDEDCAADDPFCSLSCMTNSGDSCMFCGLEGLFGDCIGLQCVSQGLPLLSCMESCALEWEDTIGCMYDTCRPQFDAYWTCARPVMDGGSCDASFTGCAELSGG